MLKSVVALLTLVVSTQAFGADFIFEACSTDDTTARFLVTSESPGQLTLEISSLDGSDHFFGTTLPAYVPSDFKAQSYVEVPAPSTLMALEKGLTFNEENGSGLSVQARLVGSVLTLQGDVAKTMSCSRQRR